jgi:hypothetical protein
MNPLSLRERVRVRGQKDQFIFSLYMPHPDPLPKGEGVSFYTASEDTVVQVTTVPPAGRRS